MSNDLDFIATPTTFTKLTNDLSGNPRYCIHHQYLLTPAENAMRRNDLNQSESLRESSMIHEHYYLKAIRRANSIGGRKYDTKGYRMAVAFTAHSLPELCDHIAYVIYKATALTRPDALVLPFSEWHEAVKRQATNALYPSGNIPR